MIRVGAKGEGGERERATWEKEVREVGVTERRVVEGGKRGAVELDCEGAVGGSAPSKRRGQLSKEGGTHKAVVTFDRGALDVLVSVILHVNFPQLQDEAGGALGSGSRIQRGEERRGKDEGSRVCRSEDGDAHHYGRVSHCRWQYPACQLTEASKACKRGAAHVWKPWLPCAACHHALEMTNLLLHRSDLI